MSGDNAAAPRIVRVFSNNAVLVRHEDAAAVQTQEYVLVGRGIGFQRKPGDVISSGDADHQYVELSADKIQFVRSLDSFDREVLETITGAVDLSVDFLGELHPSVYVVLAEHISFAVQRVGQGEAIRNSLMAEIRAAFPEEFHAAELVVGYLNANLAGIDLPIDEAAFIALHLNAARTGVTVKQPLATAHELASLVNLVCAQLGVDSGDHDHTLAVELNRLSRRLQAGRWRHNDARRSIERDLPRELETARRVIARILATPVLPKEAVGETAFLAMFLHGWLQTEPTVPTAPTAPNAIQRKEQS